MLPTNFSNRATNKPAFTLTEIILVIALVTIVSSIGVAVGIQAFSAQQLSANRDLLVSSLYQAQASARASVNNTNWGVHITSANELYIFSGNDFASRDTTEDISFNLSNNVEITGTTEIVFTRVSGLPDSIASFVLTDSGTSLTINVNDLGTIDQ